MKELNSRQKAFADYYIECGNATEASLAGERRGKWTKNF